MRKPVSFIMIILFAVLALSVYLALFWGAIKITPFGPGNDISRLIIFKLRLPRILLAIFAGAGLSVSGVVFQALLRNPLADPYILGTSSGAALGATVALLLGFSSYYYGVPLLAFVFALLSLILVYKLAQLNGKMSATTLLLAGVIVNTFLSGVITLLMSLNRKELYEIIFWIMGSLDQTDMTLIKTTGAIVLVSTAVLYLYSHYLNVITLGEDKAQTLGVGVETLRKILFVLVSLIIALVVSVCGMIGFVGLIMPHIGRLLVGPNHKVLIPVSGLLGAIFLILCDVLARTIAAPIEIPIGVITALAGAPFFLYLLRRKKTSIEYEV